jgi:hypothetical protein
MQNAQTNQITVISTPVEGYIPSSYSLKLGVAPVPAENFVAAVDTPVYLSELKPFKSRRGQLGLSVVVTCAVSGRSETFVALSTGFPGGEGSPAAREFLAAVREVVSTGARVYLGVAGNSSGYFCAISSEPFGSASVESGSSDETFAF